MTDRGSTVRRALIVANPISGRGQGERAAEELRRALEQRGLQARCCFTTARGEAPRIVREADPTDLVIAVGGDGTLSEVLQGLADPRTPVGLLPCGTANVLARALGLPASIPAAVESFLGGRIQELDVARVGERLSHLVVSVGFDARVVREVEARRRGPITKSVYLGAAWRALAGYRPVPLRVSLDGEPWESSVGMVWVANTAKYADLLHLAGDARLDDGRWEVYLFPSGRLPELVASFLRGLVSRLPGGPIRMRRARSVRIEAPEPVPCQVDGDLHGTTPLEVSLLPAPYQLLVP